VELLQIKLSLVLADKLGLLNIAEKIGLPLQEAKNHVKESFVASLGLNDLTQNSIKLFYHYNYKKCLHWDSSPGFNGHNVRS